MRQNYEEAVAREKRFFDGCAEVHDLPDIFHYWSNRHLVPKVIPFGFSNGREMVESHLAKICNRDKDKLNQFVSLGTGNCDLEIDLVRRLRGRGHDNFVIECLDLSQAMLERGRAAAQAQGVCERTRFVWGDLNEWSASREYDAAIAIQSLHHIVNLEGLFEEVRRSLHPRGCFLIADMIGRNGHKRWPEALDIVDEFWRKLPPSYRFNRLLGTYEEAFEDWDCSTEGFEGVRAQDVLPLLLRYFRFHVFVPYGNVIDPFIDRAFGHNFDVKVQWDCAFIDEVHRRDDQEIAAGHITPTHLFAVVGKEHEDLSIVPGSLTPESCVRHPGKNMRQKVRPAPVENYEWHAWPHSAQQQLDFVCRRLAASSQLIKKRTEYARGLNDQLEERTRWALRLEKDVEERTAWARRIDAELQERTRWALNLEAEVGSLSTGLQLQAALALSVQRELDAERLRRAQLEKDLHGLLHNPFRLVARLVAGVLNRVRSAFQSRPRWNSRR